LLTPDFVKLSHNGASDAQASVYLWVGVAIGVNQPLTCTELVAVDRLESGIRVSASFQIVASTFRGKCPGEKFPTLGSQ